MNVVVLRGTLSSEPVEPQDVIEVQVAVGDQHYFTFVDTAAIQLASALGAEVWVTASLSKHERCKALGAHHTIDYREEDFEARLKAAGGADPRRNGCPAPGTPTVGPSRG